MRIFSGLRPSGEIHLGNYLGAIKQWIELQEKHDCIFCVVDLHAITTPYHPKTFLQNVYRAAADYLALGLDLDKCLIFIQSQVKEHTELAWLLNTMTAVGELTRMTQYKEKSRQIKESPNVGLLDYPVLMAADILLYQTELVPVGEDQVQHVELARTIARKFNRKFGRVFTIPKAQLPKLGGRIMSLIEPEKKMAKSGNPEGYIAVFESPKEIKRKIMSAKTDPGKEVKYDSKNKPGVSNLLVIYSLLSGKSIPELEKEFDGAGYQEFKEALAELLVEKLAIFRERKKELSTSRIKEVLEEGAENARKIARPTLRQVQQKMGLLVG